MTTTNNGQFVWHEHLTKDPKAAIAFYSGLFGWDVEEGPPEAGGYSIASLRGRTVAGIGPQMNPAAPPSWMRRCTSM